VMTVPTADLTMCKADESFTGSQQDPDSGNFIAPLFTSSVYNRAYSGSSCSSKNSGGGHAIVIVGWKTVPDMYGAMTESWIILNSWGKTGDDGFFYLPINKASIVDDLLTNYGSVELRSPFGVAFTKPTRRALAAAAAREPFLRRRLQNSTSSIQTPSAVGFMKDCSRDTDLVQRAAAEIKQSMEANSNLVYSDFVVSSFLCQNVANGVNIKAAISAVEPVNAKREYQWVTMQLAMSGAINNTATAGAATAAKLRRLKSHDAIRRHGRMLATTSSKIASAQGPSASLSASSKVENVIVANASTASNQIKSSVILDQTTLPSTTAKSDASFAVTPITNPNGFDDPFTFIGGVRSAVGLVITAIIVIGCFLGALVLYVIYFIYTHRHIFAHLREHWGGLEKLLHPDVLLKNAAGTAMHAVSDVAHGVGHAASFLAHGVASGVSKVAGALSVRHVHEGAPAASSPTADATKAAETQPPAPVPSVNL